MVFCDNCGHELRSTAKFCGACGTKAETTSQDTNQHSVDETPPPKHGYQRAPGNDMGITTSRPAGRIWYLLPLLFGIFGGIIAYAVIRNRNPRRARNIMILAVVLLIPHILLGIIFDDDFEIGSQLSEEEIMEQVTKALNAIQKMGEKMFDALFQFLGIEISNVTASFDSEISHFVYK